MAERGPPHFSNRDNVLVWVDRQNDGKHVLEVFTREAGMFVAEEVRRKSSPSFPDFKGEEIACWVNEGQKGEYLSIVVEESRRFYAFHNHGPTLSSLLEQGRSIGPSKPSPPPRVIRAEDADFQSFVEDTVRSVAGPGAAAHIERIAARFPQVSRDALEATLRALVRAGRITTNGEGFYRG